MYDSTTWIEHKTVVSETVDMLVYTAVYTILKYPPYSFYGTAAVWVGFWPAKHYAIFVEETPRLETCTTYSSRRGGKTLRTLQPKYV